MPFDGLSNHHDAVPDTVRLLDRAKELIATDNRWIKKSLVRYDGGGGVRRCLYGALFQADRELFRQLPGADLNLLYNKKVIKGTIFGRVHTVVNREARPRLLFWSQRKNFGVRYNDRAQSVGEVHDLMDRVRARLLINHRLLNFA